MRVWSAAALCGLVGLAGLAGCSGGEFGLAGGASTTGATLTGKVRGGQQAIAGAHVYLFAANTTGYGGAGISASTSNASLSLLTSGTGTTLDTSGGATNGDYYVTTDSGGNWTITGDYVCTPGQQVYVYALGGNPGAGTNAAAGLMAVLGACPAAGNFATATPFVVINEVSTVAAAYAFAGFAADVTHVSSSGTALAQTGIANAFANAANLETLSTGVALTTTPAGNGTVPQAEIDTLANVLASCVNTNGPSSTSCTTLFTNATADGTASGAQPTDTATAAINIAHYPGTNVVNLYGLAGGTPPFAPGLTTQPNDWTVGVNFAGGDLGTPTILAIDGSGNVWTKSATGNAIVVLSSTGSEKSPAGGYPVNGILGMAMDSSGDAWIVTGSNITELSNSGTVLSGSGYLPGTFLTGAVAIDGAGDAWVGGSLSGGIAEISNSGVVISSGYDPSQLFGSSSIAMDGSGDAWVPSVGFSSVFELSSTGAVLSGSSGYTGGGISNPYSAAVDGSGDAWVINNGSVVVKLSNAGAPLSGSGGYTGGGLNSPQSVAIDGAGNAWFTNGANNSVTELSNSGTALSPSTGYTGGGIVTPRAIGVDGSGDVWVTNYTTGQGLSELIGAAAPVITPIAAGLPAVHTLDGSSKLGTRP